MIDPTLTHLSIPLPRSTQNLYRGFHETIAPTAVPISTRWTLKDREYISKQAQKLGVTFSEFVRWCAYYAADEVARLDRQTSFREAEAARRRSKINTDEYSEDTQ
jgi:hypothetical protein